MLTALRYPIYRQNLGARGVARVRRIINPHQPLVCILPEYRILYFQVAKTGSSSILSLIAKHYGLEDASQLELTEHIDVEDYADYTRFAVVRNPWDRLVSCYIDRFVSTQDMQHEGVYLPFLKYNLIPGIPKFRAEMSFDEFALAVSRIPDRFADMHFVSQCCSLCTRAGNLIVNHVCRFESFHVDLMKIEEKTGFPFSSVGHIRKRQAGKRYQERYDARTKEIVAARYRRDIELFDYSFE